MFHPYSQINVNGCFLGLRHVIVEVANRTEVEVIAQRGGVCFDGVSTGRDRACCGDRWTRSADECARREDARASIPGDRAPEGDGASLLRFHGSAA